MRRLRRLPQVPHGLLRYDQRLHQYHHWHAHVLLRRRERQSVLRPLRLPVQRMLPPVQGDVPRLHQRLREPVLVLGLVQLLRRRLQDLHPKVRRFKPACSAL